MNETFANLASQLRGMASHLAANQYKVDDLIIGAQATGQEIRDLEVALQLALPPSLSQILTQFSGDVFFNWTRPESADFPAPFKDCFSGGIWWSPKMIIQNQAGAAGWANNPIEDPPGPADAV